MDLITGKAKEAFLKHENQPEAWLKIMQMSKSDTVLHALLVDWLDSVGIYIELNRATQSLEFKWWFYTISDSKGIHLNNYLHNIVKIDDRHQATQEAIKKAVEIFNSKK